MSRAYKVCVAESLRTVMRGEDEICGTIEILEILPRDEMAGVVAAELEARGFVRRADGTVASSCGGVEVVVDPRTGKVTVRVESVQEVELQAQASGHVTDEAWEKRLADAREGLKEKAVKALADDAAAQQSELRRRATAALEKALEGLRPELDQAVNRATATALKRRAAQLGAVKEMTEEPDGSLTIKVEL